MTAADIRPDFYLLNHLHDDGLIHEASFERAKTRGEIPYCRIFNDSGGAEMRREVRRAGQGTLSAIEVSRYLTETPGIKPISF